MDDEQVGMQYAPDAFQQRQVNDENQTLTSSRRPLLQNPRFLIFWSGQTISSLGNAFAFLAMPLIVLQITHSVLQMGIVTGIVGGSQFIASLFAGILVDRLDRRKLMIFCDTIRTVLFLSIPLCWWLIGPHIWLIYVVVGSGSCLGMIFQVGFTAAIPQIVASEQVAEANSFVQGSLAFAFVIGPVFAGIVSSTFGATTAIIVNALSFAISALSLLVVQFKPITDSRIQAERIHSWNSLLAGVRFLWHEPFLRVLAFLNAGYFLLTAAALDLFLFHLKEDLGNSGAAIGIVFSLAGIGTILGSVLSPFLRNRLGFGVCWLGGFGLTSLVIAVIGFTTNIWLMALWGILFTFGDVLIAVCSVSVRQEIPPPYLHGRVMAIFMTLTLLPQMAGATFITFLASKVGTPFMLTILGLIGFLLTLIGIFTPVRMRKPEYRAKLYAEKEQF